MARRCPDCQIDLDRYGDRHRCVTKIVGARKPTKLEADKIARGEMSAADLLPKERPAPTQPAGRLAPRPADTRPAQAREPQPQLSEILKAIDRLTAQFEALQAALLSKELSRNDAGNCSYQQEVASIMNTGGALGNLMVAVLAAFSQFETELRKERQIEGIRRAHGNKEVSEKTGRLKYSGREPTLDRKKVLALKAEGKTPSQIARELKIARSSVYRLLAA